ncbi:MOSC domain-containing protein [Nocardioides sp. CFH 31398]|uniref:MOSC domain-containing protein n=1 Tax=Nocardioides sp. CFH 31398 TaxID=2919579 RepID=UPI001F06103F|nr:MOSC domain-containing protein [Nocardioides sp. CFH 31398]MCH1867692.1 MOSC domain-containing protein [Nocardioides sp. CFH 31398]
MSALFEVEVSTTLTAIHLAKGRRLPTKDVERAVVETQKGIVGDRYHGTRHRHVSLQSRAQLDEAAATYGAPIASELTRRNLTLADGVVPTAPGTRITVGEGEDAVELEVVRVAAPCKLLDDTIGPDAQHALRRRAGTICRVLSGGEIAVGDTVTWVAP